MNVFHVAFFGHRYIENMYYVEQRLEKEIRRLIKENEYVNFYVGRNGDFDQCVASSVLRVQKAVGNENSCLVLALPYSTAEFRNNQKSFEEYYGAIEISYLASQKHPKAAIKTRNFEMIDRADLVICYVTTNSGGAFQAVDYAKKQDKEIINLADQWKISQPF